MGIRRMLVALVLVALVLVPWTVVSAMQFSVVHKYAHLEGSPANSQGRGVSQEYFQTLVAHHHHRSRLFAAVEFPLGGSDDVNYAGLYFTQITLGTPPRQFYVQVDTGSDVLWVDCAPCNGCPPSSTLPGVTVTPYDPTLSSTDIPLACTAANCGAASNAANASCDLSGACAYNILYGDGSNSTGYILSDVFTFTQAPNTSASANISFGCGTTLVGFDQPQGAVGGLMGFGQSPVSLPSQLANQGLAAHVFAHCLQGDSQIGGGFFVIGNISEPDVVYTPLINGTTLYNVGMQNIAVDGANITTPDVFAIVPGVNLGVIMDSGTTFATVAEPAFTQFLTAITNAAPGTPIQDEDNTTCWPFTGDIATAFPSVTLYFDGGAVMNLGPRNYLFPFNDTEGATYQCMAWSSSTLPGIQGGITIWGDIVLKDQLVVYDNSLQRIGWKPFNCSEAVNVIN